MVLSLNWNVAHTFPGLPSVLYDCVVLGVGPAAAGCELVIPVRETMLAPGIMYFAQGLVADAHGVRSTPVRNLVLDPTAPQ